MITKLLSTILILTFVIHIRIYADLNVNGQQDDNEPYLAGVPVGVHNFDTGTIITGTSNETGEFISQSSEYGIWQVTASCHWIRLRVTPDDEFGLLASVGVTECVWMPVVRK